MEDSWYLGAMALTLGPILWTGFVWDHGRRYGERGAKEKAWQEAWRELVKHYLPTNAVQALVIKVANISDMAERQDIARKLLEELEQQTRSCE